MIEFPLKGPRGEPVDLWRIFVSHGVADLPPMRVDEAARSFEVTLRMDGGAPRTARISAGRPGHGAIHILGRAAGQRRTGAVVAAVRRILRLDEDLSEFYAAISSDPQLAWAARGAGRMIRSPTVFEEVVKTICTTNCAWSATRRMVGALVEHLGEKAPGAPPVGWTGRAFPTPEAMADAGARFYRRVARAGYRGPYLRSLARSVADGKVDLEALGRARPDEISDEEVEARLRALPGVGPYAAAHVMLMLGRYSRLILDSWTRPKYARLLRRRAITDAAIARRFKPYGRYAGLAFWLFLTRDWVEEPPAVPAP
ncbi:MAG: DNA-3-methyladenine glycosylase family protein [Armatimonadota bacterium]